MFLEKLTGVRLSGADRGVWHRLMATRFIAETGDAAGFTALVLLLSRAADSAAELSTMLAALVVIDAVVTPLCGSVGDRFDRQHVMLLSCAGGAACYAGMFFAAGTAWMVFALALSLIHI